VLDTHRAGPGPVSTRSAGESDTVSTRSLWPPAEAAQADYESLRRHLLERGVLPDCLAAARFGRRGLAGLITWPVSEPVFARELLGAARERWNPHADDRVSALAAGYQFLLQAAAAQARPAAAEARR
jgi:hypothetical protein